MRIDDDRSRRLIHHVTGHIITSVFTIGVNDKKEKMPAYLITNVRFTNAEKAQEYGRQVASTIQKYGGRYLARGGQVEVAEGDWRPGYVAIVEFPSLEQAKCWYDSDEYRQIKPLRVENADSQIIFVDGLASLIDHN